jgi:hypothetical protein
MPWPAPPSRVEHRASLDLATGDENGPRMVWRPPTGHHGADELDYWGFTWDRTDDHGFPLDHDTPEYHRMNEARWHSPRNLGHRLT